MPCAEAGGCSLHKSFAFGSLLGSLVASGNCSADCEKALTAAEMQFDQPTHGFRDSSGFVNRLPLRLESKELIVWGMADPEKMWSEFADEEFQPILVGGKAVVTGSCRCTNSPDQSGVDTAGWAVWINDFSDTDCGGSYLEVAQLLIA